MSVDPPPGISPGSQRLVFRAALAMVVFGMAWHLTENALAALGLAALVIAPTALSRIWPGG